MEITSEQVREAVRTAHSQCNVQRCIHAAAFAGCMERVSADAERAARIGELKGNAALAAYYEGMHVGFRLAQILQEEEAKPAI